MKYTIAQTAVRPDFNDFNAPAWQRAEEKKLDYVYPESSAHHPDVRVKLLYDENAVYGMFQVKDRYVRAPRTKDQDAVCNDSCVEIFLHPGNNGYHSFEMNCCGTLLSFFIRNAQRTQDGFEDYSILEADDLALVKRYPSISAPAITEEITEPLTWTLGFEISMELFRRWGAVTPASGTVWRGMFYKCGDETSHPHWLSCKKYPTLNFHQPEFFGELIFE